MNAAREHEIVPAIRDWIRATADVEVATGLSRDEARRRASELLAAIAAGSVQSEQENPDDLKDVLWAMVEELDDRQVGHSTFEECDRAYQFVLALSVEDDHFEELDEILRRIARIGWQSSPDGLEETLKGRAVIWGHGDELQHREVCESADELLGRMHVFRGQGRSDVAELRETCARLFMLANIRPRLVGPYARSFEADLADRHIGWLDDRENLIAASALAAGVAERQIGRLDMAESAYRRAELSIRRTVNIDDLDRVKVERLAIALIRGHFCAVRDSAPRLIDRLTIPRERLKAQVIVANALINLGEPDQARLLLEAAQQNECIDREPALKVFLLTLSGSALSELGKDLEAVSAFKSAGAVLQRFFHPLQLAFLAGTIGEHLAKSGKFKEAISLYDAAREKFREIGQLRQFGYLSVLRAELLMLTGAYDEAEAALLAAIPLIEEFDLQREGLAAVALLREAMAKRRTDVKTIQMVRDQLRKGLQ